jgi:dipeptidyl aminopeptidase/acylaminoacyl peptidase
MTAAAPPRPPELDESPDRGTLEALIEEARRRTRRRRQGYAGAALLAAAAGVVAFLGFHHGGGGAGKPAADGELPNAAISRAASSVRPVARGGQLTMLASSGTDGWYDLRTVVRGRLHPFIRCPWDSGWCGEVFSVAWSRDGTRLAFSVTSLGGTARFNGVHIVSLRTGQDRWELTSHADPVDLEWSPDGSRLAFASGSIIYVMDAATFRERRLATTGSSGFDSSPSWSPKGTRLVFAEQRNRHSAVYLIDVNSSRGRLLASGASAPAWSPDGTKIAYRSSCGGIKLITADGKDVTPGRSHSPCKTIGVSGTPAWSPDGKKIAIIAARAFTPGGTYVMDADGGHLALLTSADGKAQSYVHTADASWQPQRIPLR